MLVDTSPDLREQLLDAEVDWLDGVLYTHEHADHTHGIDDLRALFIKQRRRVDVYLDEQTGDDDAAPASAIASSRRPAANIRRSSTEHRLTAGQPVTIAGQGGADHGAADPAGARRHRLARLPLRQRRLFAATSAACRRKAPRRLAGLDVWIVDALRYRPHPSHFSLADALGWIERLKPQPRDPDQPARRSRLRGAAQAIAAACRAGFRRDDAESRAKPAAACGVIVSCSIICLMRMAD